MSNNRKSRICPKTCIIFVTYGRPDIASKSYESLENAISIYRDEIKIIISDATNSDEKYNWLKNTQADDIIHTPKFTPAATSRNLAITLMMDKYVPQNICMIEDDFTYDEAWYPTLVNKTEECYGVISPLDLAYGMFSASQHHIPEERKKFDKENDLIAYYFGAVAYQRFMPLSHYLSVLRYWDADVLGISYAQTGLQTFRNTMRGFCGGITPEPLSWPIDQDSTGSTWSKGKRDPGPPAHSFELEKYKVIQEQVKKTGSYKKHAK